jgi:hypothetical protein
MRAAPCAIDPASRRRPHPHRRDARDRRCGPPCQTADATCSERPRLRYGQNERGLALTRKNYLFAGSDAGGERAAIAYTILGSCRIVGINPIEYLSDVLPRLGRRIRISELLELLPARWKARRSARPDSPDSPDRRTCRTRRRRQLQRAEGRCPRDPGAVNRRRRRVGVHSGGRTHLRSIHRRGPRDVPAVNHHGLIAARAAANP